MSLTLILMRHAKSAWDDPAQDDFDRPLNGRGRVSAPAIGDWLVQKGYLPDIVIVSGARRTVESWERMSSKLPETAVMESAPALYLAAPQILMGVLRTQRVPTVMMISHNPGIGQLASLLAKSAPSHPKFRQYPTAATTILQFQEDTWDDISPAQGEVLDFVVPRDLI